MKVRVDEAQARQQFVEHMLAHTASLFRNAAPFPHGSALASGFLVRNGEDFRLITAGHQFEAAGSWTLETSAAGPAGTLHVALRELQLLAHVDLDTSETQSIDLAWADIEGSRPRERLDYVLLGAPTPGTSLLQGSSGAPIADPEGRIVAVVLGGDSSGNIIRGMELSRYASLFRPAV